MGKTEDLIVKVNLLEENLKAYRFTILDMQKDIGSLKKEIEGIRQVVAYELKNRK